MKKTTAFFRLVRWPNLFFIALTQCLFYYCIIVPSLPADYYLLPHKLTAQLFSFLVIASIFIAAGGYIINDYFDINIDLVNKPDRKKYQSPLGHFIALDHYYHWCYDQFVCGYKNHYHYFDREYYQHFIIVVLLNHFQEKIIIG